MDIGSLPDGAAALPLAHNMKPLGITWDQIDALAFSHFHPDHVGGEAAWKAGRASLDGDTTLRNDIPVFAPAMFEFMERTPVLLKDAYLLAPGIATTGAIEYGETYPMSLYAASGIEQALAVNVAGEGIVLILGCGHPTVERLVVRAEALFEQPVVGVVGGFHYEGKTAADVQDHIRFLQARPLRLVALSPHDSSPEALQAFREAFADIYQEVEVGVPVKLGQ
jgi:7,8-dihydropterin-6-yl-methyl-4-(beta-D-ribofuranosyl)aminobenzene 5'-phosphate synthase